PTVLEQTDDMFLRNRFWLDRLDMKLMPSEYFHRNFWSTFMIDTVGMRLRDMLNIDHLMWSTDYPHSGTDLPNSRVTLSGNFGGLAAARGKTMCQDTPRRLYKMGVPAS